MTLALAGDARMLPNPRAAGGIAVPVTLMSVSVVIEVAGMVGFLFLMAPNLPGVRALPRLTGPSKVLVRCLALLTGIYPYVVLYVMAPP